MCVHESDCIVHSLIVWEFCGWEFCAMGETVLVGGGLLCVMQKNQQCLSPPPCRMTVQRNLWIPNASFLFHSMSKCNLISSYSFSKQCGMVEGNSAPDERSGKRTVFFFSFLTMDTALGGWNIY